MTQILCFTGFSRAGKDDFARPLLARGWKAMPFSAPIKEFFADYIAAEQGVGDLFQRMQRVNPALDKEQLDRFLRDVLIPFEEKDIMDDVFTENDESKKAFRPILEHGGELIYDYVHATYFDRLDAALARGERVVNTRVARLEEAHDFATRGAPIYLVDRSNWPATSAWEQGMVDGLISAGLVTHTLYNHGTHDEWLAQAESFAAALDRGAA